MEPFTICTTGDLHLGMRFSKYPSIREHLVNARFTALERIIAKANAETCALLVIAGDFFNSINVPAKEVERSLALLKQFEGNCILFLPGNHDYYTGMNTGIWEVLGGADIDNLVLLTEKKPYPLTDYHLPVTVYPGPCWESHGTENAVGWIREESRGASESFHLGIAHGSIGGISPDLTKSYFPMEKKELENLFPDLWIVGHTHVPYPEKEETLDTLLIPGTPEPDGFDYPHVGSAWIVSVGADKSVRKTRFFTGSYQFRRMVREVHVWEDLEEILGNLKKIAAPSCLLRLELAGALPKQDLQHLGEFTEKAGELFFYAEIKTEGIKAKITPAEIGNEFREGSFPYLLLSRLAEKKDGDALQHAYRLLEDMKK